VSTSTPPAAPPPWAPLPGAAHAIALEVLLRGPLSRSELARRLGLSAGSLTRLARPLLESGLLVEAGQGRGPGTGRPTRPLEVVAGAHHFVGAKITDEDVHVVLTDLRATVLRAARAPLPGRDPATVVATAARLGREVAEGAPTTPTAVGVSLGGRVAAGGVVTGAPFLGWRRDVPLGEQLADAFGLPVVVDNDLLALTRAEHWFGPGREHDRFAVLTTGISVGYGLVVHDRLVDSPDAGLGLIGHLPLDPLGPLCPDGHRGCATAMLAAPSLSAAVSTGRRRETGYEECLDLAAAGDPVARPAVEAAGAALGRLMAMVANLTLVSRILLTGEGIRLADVAREAVEEGVRRHRSAGAEPLVYDVRPIDHAQWARGAAAAAIQDYVLGGGRSPLSGG
jgi:predicted NBD/HSP70 family sugar kinase